METVFMLLAICAGNSPVNGEFPSQRPVMPSFDVFFHLFLNGWVDKGEAGDLRRHRTHYDDTVMLAMQIHDASGFCSARVKTCSHTTNSVQSFNLFDLLFCYLYYKIVELT